MSATREYFQGQVAAAVTKALGRNADEVRIQPKRVIIELSLQEAESDLFWKAVYEQSLLADG